MKAQLIPLDGGRAIPLNRDVTLVGRKQGLVDLCIDNGSISKLQCLIVKTDGLLFIRDLGSTNGTKVNGQRVTRGALLPGDELAFASVRFRVEMGPGDAEVVSDAATEMLTSFPDSDEQADYIAADSDADAEMGSDSDVRLLPDDSAV